MIISISSYLFDIQGHFVLHVDPANSRLESTRRRLTRTATLDGNSDINDSGYSPADSTLEIAIRSLTQTQYDGLKRLVRLHSEIVVCTVDGAFLGAIEEINELNVFKIIFLIKRKLSA